MGIRTGDALSSSHKSGKARGMIYHRPVQIEFNHCDPAGIVFFPRFYEMVSSVCENFYKDVADYPYATMMAAGQGVPTVRVETDFHAPARLGDVLDFRLEVVRLGRSSITVAVTAWTDHNRLSVTMTQAFVQGLKAVSWPDEVRARIKAFMAD
jgi:4-hydroxybenzoyl-CoA thioesterase